MSNLRFHIPYSAVSLCLGAVATLLVVYIGLIAVVMSYAALTVEFSQSVRNNESAVAILEGQYLANVARITSANYITEGYVKPATTAFVRSKSATALR